MVLFYPYNFWIEFSISDHCDSQQVQRFAKIRRIWSNFPILACTKLSYAISCFRSAILTHLLIKDFSNVNFFEIFLVWRKTILVQKKLWKLLSWGKESDCNYEVSDLCCKNNLVNQIIAFSSKAATERSSLFKSFCILPSMLELM